MTEPAGRGRHTLPEGPATLGDQDGGDGIDFGAMVLPLDPDHHIALSGSSGDVLDTVIITALDVQATLAVTAYATPRSGGYGQWADHANRQQCAQVGAIGITDRDGPLGTEIVARMPNGSHRTFFTIEGPCWLLRAVLHSRPGRHYTDRLRARAFLATCGVRRGPQPYPPGEALPVSLPPDWASEGPI